MTSAHEHRKHAPQDVRAAVLTVSDSRKPGNDASGDRAADLLAASGTAVTWRRLVPDEAAVIAAAVTDALRADDVDAVVVTGGTGVSARDVTVEAVRPLFAKELPGFGEVFRRLSFDAIGAAAFLSRATAGVTADGRPVFLLPGSPAAVDLAVTQLVAPELPHLVGVARRGRFKS